MTTPGEPSSLRRHVYLLLIVVAGGMALGRILSAHLVLEPELHRREDDPSSRGRKWPPARPRPMPTFSSNDRSRWCTVRALVDRGTYVIGTRNPETVLASATALLAAPGPL